MTSVVRYNHVRIVFQFVLVPIPPMHHHWVECYLLTVEVATLHPIVHAADIAFRKAHLNGMISFSLRICWYCEREGEITIFLHLDFASRKYKIRRKLGGDGRGRSRPDIVTDVTIINKVNIESDHRLVMSNIKLDIEVERKTFITKRPPSVDSIRIG